MWLSFEAWQGGNGVFTAIGQAAGPGFLSWARLDPALTAAQLLMIAFCVAHCAIIWVGVRHLRLIVYVTSPLQLVFYAGVIGWACHIAPVGESLAWVAGTGSFIAWLVAINASAATWSTLVRRWALDHLVWMLMHIG